MNKTHGCGGRGTETTEYRAWRKMRARCTYPGKKNITYFEKRIRVCDKWNDFSQFLLDMGKKPSAKHSLDRIDNDKGYGPDNCRWATRSQQDRNKTCNVFIELNGLRYCQKDFAAIFGVTDATIIAKFHKGWTVEKIVDYYEEKHGKNYRTKTSTFSQALTSLGRWYNNGKSSFFKVGEVLGGVL